MKLWSALFAAGVASARAVNSYSSNTDSIKSTSEPVCDPPQPLAQTAKTQYVNINGTKLAYRRFGKPNGNPVVHMPHFRASMDTTDPLLFNYIAQYREVILFDNAGIGHSDGAVPSSIAPMGDTAVSLVKALDIEQAVFFGFSLGGFVAQYISFTYPDLVEKAVFSGTAPSANANFTAPDPQYQELAASSREPTVEDFLTLFFEPTATSRATGQDWWKRLSERSVEGEENSGWLLGPGITAQNNALGSFISDLGNFPKLKNVTAQALVTNGHRDVMLPTPNSFFLQQALPYAYLDVYPDSGHGHLFQFPKKFAGALREFLEN